MRIVVVKTKEGTISCLSMSQNKKYYLDRYNVVTFVNKLWNPYHVNIIKKYFIQDVASSEN